MKIKVNRCNVINAQQVIRQLTHHPEWANWINQVDCPLGSIPGYGYFLLDWDEYLENFPETDTFDIRLGPCPDPPEPTSSDEDPVEELPPGCTVLRGYVMVKAQGAVRIKNGPMIVTVADKRYLWQHLSVSISWPPETSYATMFADLGDLFEDDDVELLMPEGADATPPLGVRYHGVNLLEAVEDLAFRAGLVLRFDPEFGKLTLEYLWGGPGQTITAPVYRNYQSSPSSQQRTKLALLSHRECRNVYYQSFGSGRGKWLTMWTFQNRESDEDAEDEVLALNDVLEAMTFRSHSTIEYFGLLQLKPDSYIYNLRWKVIENLYTTTVFKGEQKLPELIEPRLLECGGDGLFRFILKEDCGQCGEADAKLISPVLCIETDDIRVIDTIGLCELQFDETEGPYAPENSMGFAKLLGDGLYEIVSIAIGCCDEEVPPCPQIPGVPMGVIGVGADTIKWVLGFDEDGCLVRVPVGDCCTIEEDSSGIGEFFEGSSSIGGSEGEGEEEEEEEEEEPKGKT